jgi:hypothetical protein
MACEEIACHFVVHVVAQNALAMIMRKDEIACHFVVYIIGKSALLAMTPMCGSLRQLGTRASQIF